MTFDEALDLRRDAAAPGEAAPRGRVPAAQATGHSPQPTAQPEASTFSPLKSATARRDLREEQRPAFRAALGAVLRTLFAMTLSAGLALGAWQAWQWALRAPLFSLREVRFTGLAHAHEAELLRRSGLALGENIFHADLAAAARAVEAHPWVKTARLSRRPPAAIAVEVVEHRAVAQVQLGSLYLLDESGSLFKKAAPGDAVDLPLVTGLPREDWLGKRPELQLRLLSALQLFDAWKSQGLPLSALEEVRLDDDSGVTVFARDAEGGDATARLQEIRVGARSFAQRLGRLAQIRAALARRGERAARIDLDNDARPDWASAQLDRDSTVRRP